ncbi:putative protease S8 tripeptidyl peptidase I [Talaromyces proteolyticus]|uniref:Protease S8 tripeptidyl peptidase I n=1 Tax=Talaromyces proteolyticus TaxID=1131652 RepID=A0AAD4KTV3_9EURO|nr:putative protease S8 tripeptidyl peptidase I [Talaromyces proteolyticus]KAH8696765.1 putative protease S8 tripeptidyl peptidase I [Talaromyces proteolyticus]
MTRIISLTALVAALATFSAARPSSHTHAVHEKRGAISARWSNAMRVRSDADMHVKIGLRQSNLHHGHDILMDVSNPSSKNYRKFWTEEDVHNMFAPSDESVSAVKHWLADSGIHDIRITHSDNKGWLAFIASGDELENLLHTDFYEYIDSETGDKAIAAEQYHVPKHIQGHIDYITPGIRLPYLRKRSNVNKIYKPAQTRHVPKFAPMSANTIACDKLITPDCVAALYNIPKATVTPSPNNSLGIFEENDYYTQSDLDSFFTHFPSYKIPNGTAPTPAFIDGAKAPEHFGGSESNLDFMLAYPIIYPQNITLYQTDDPYYATGSHSQGYFNTFLDAIDGSYCTSCYAGECGNDPLDPIYPDVNSTSGYKGKLMCGVYKPTNVISISYVGSEDSIPRYYYERQCNEFMKLGLRGVSVFFASGDSGVASRNGCLGNNTIFNPERPASCPYITSVGATKLPENRTVNDPEVAANDPAGHPYISAFASGGGFSNVFSIPNYQADAVANYFEKHNPPYPYYNGSILGENGGLYNRSGRGYPDVSANGDNIAVYNNGKYTINGGTSASAPIFASIVNRIIDERIAAGKSGPLGFLNPILYKNADAFNDITEGTNSGCGTDGFSTAPGWDPVTGLGTPNYPKLKEVLLNI